MENVEGLQEEKLWESVYFEQEKVENNSLNIDSYVESEIYNETEMSQSHEKPIIVLPETAEQQNDSGTVYHKSNISRKITISQATGEDDVDLELLKAQQELDELMAKSADICLVDQSSENIDEVLLNIPTEKKKSKPRKETSEAIEDFGAVPERRKSKKKKDKEAEEPVEEENGDSDKKKKKKKKKDSKSAAPSRATSRAPSPTLSFAPPESELHERRQATKSAESNTSDKQGNWCGICGTTSSGKAYMGPLADRYKQIARDVNNLDRSIHSLNENAKLFHARILKQRYWQKPEIRNTKQVYASNTEVSIPNGHSQHLTPSRHNGESRYSNTSKTFNNHMPITLSYQIINPAPVVHRPVCNIDSNTQALTAAIAKLATSQLEEARVKHQRDDKLINMNTKLMDSLQSLGRCVENLAVNNTPVYVNQYNAMPDNVRFGQEHLGGINAGSRRYKSQNLEQEAIYTPGNMSYDMYPYAIMAENRYMRIGHFGAA